MRDGPASRLSAPDMSLPVGAIHDFCRRRRIRRLALFGSVLRSDFGPQSDVDVLVELEPGTRMGFAFFGLADELGEILGRRVDLHTPASLSRYLRDEVLASAQTIYAAAE